MPNRVVIFLDAATGHQFLCGLQANLDELERTGEGEEGDHECAVFQLKGLHRKVKLSDCNKRKAFLLVSDEDQYLTARWEFYRKLGKEGNRGTVKGWGWKVKCGVDKFKG